jgi:hypothetical protein
MAQAVEQAAKDGTVLRARYRNLSGERSRRDILPVSGLCWNAEGTSANFTGYSFVLEHSRKQYTETGFFSFSVNNITVLEGPTGVVVPAGSIAKLVRVPADHVLVFPGEDTALDNGTFAKPEVIHTDELDYYVGQLGFQTTPWIGTVIRPEPRPFAPRGAEVRNALDSAESRNPFALL